MMMASGYQEEKNNHKMGSGLVSSLPSDEKAIIKKLGHQFKAALQQKLKINLNSRNQVEIDDGEVESVYQESQALS